MLRSSHGVRIRVRAAIVCVLLTVPLLVSPAWAQQSLGLATSRAGDDLASIAPGFDRWLEERLSEAGLDLALLPQAGSLDAALSSAADAGLQHLLVPRLVVRDGEAVVELLLYAPESGALLTASRGRAPLAELGRAAAEAFGQMIAHTGGRVGEITPPLLDDLASASLAIARRRDGDLGGAFRAVQGKLSPTAMRLREEIIEESRRASAPAPERAQVLAMLGDTTTAWSLVGRKAKQALSEPAPDPDLLVAAGEVMLANDGPNEARRFFERVIEIDPDHLEANAGLARVLERTGDRAAARGVIERIAPLDPEEPRLQETLAELADDGGTAAAHWVEAGRRAAQRLEVTRAEESFDEAVGLDPRAEPGVSAARGAMLERLGQPAKARLAYRAAVQGGAATPVVLTALGRTEHRLGDPAAAAAVLERALDEDPRHPGALRELGTVYVDTDRPAEAIPLLKEVHAADPADARTVLTLSRALRATGDADEALALLSGDAVAHEPAVHAAAAEIQHEKGDLDGARVSLLRAVDQEPGDAALRRRLALLLDQRGDSIAAELQRTLAAALDPSETGGEKQPREQTVHILSLDDLVMSFASQVASPGSRRIASLGMREPDDWKTLLRRLVRPRSPDLAAIGQGLEGAIAGRFDPVPVTDEARDVLSIHIDQLFDFDGDRSLNARTIATVNEVLAADGAFATRVIAHPDTALADRCGPGAFAVETRLLLGRQAELASILSNVECLEGGFASYGRWNAVAIALYVALGLLLLWPALRGWGQILVKIHLPERTKGFMSIHVTRRADAVKREAVDEGRRQKSTGRRFDFLRRFERHMAGPETVFRMIPVRKIPYTVTVSGPLMDARGEEVIGHFLEEQRAIVRRRRATVLEFDFRPKEVAVEITVKENGQPAASAQVALRGDPSSQRYVRDGVAYLYLEMGSYTILVGSGGAAAQFDIEISQLGQAVPLEVEMSRAEGLVFQACPDAVEPFLQSDLGNAAQALEAAGNARAAHLLRADLYRQQGKGAEAARELEAAGEIGGAALELAGESDFAGSAELYSEAGQLDEAGAAFREAGQFRKAAECFEKIYDYANALECWREAGDSEREMDMLEKLGEFMEAAQIARERGDRERVVRDLQHIEPRHNEYGDACRILAELASEDGDHDLAVSKFEEALSSTGIENASIGTLESYARVLERAGRRREALSAYEAIRRQDVARTDVATRIQTLKRELAESEGQTQRIESPTAPVESRYELLEEIGRGGMGVVYKARDKRLGRVVALKRLPDNLRDHPAAVQLFEREARAAAALNHVNIVTLFDAGEENGTYFITMELLEGRPLNAILDANGRVSVRDTMRLGIQICAGLHYAHERRIVHRDIKTANLFFTRDQVVKIMDFGIAKSMEEVRRSTTVVGGTPYYMAPEQAAGGAVDHRADLYALGVTLFQLATGQLPFEDGDVSYRHRHEDPPDPRELNLNVPADLAAEILLLMQKSPDARPANAAVVGAQLGELLGKKG